MNNEMERMRMEAVVSKFEAAFRHLLAKMRDNENPQPANMVYLPPPPRGESESYVILQHQKDEREKPGNLLTKKKSSTPLPLEKIPFFEA